MYESTTHHRDGTLAGHRHEHAHLSLVLRGTYLEFSIDGRFRCESDCLIAHPRHHWHQNEFQGCRVAVLNLGYAQAHHYRMFRLSGAARRALQAGNRPDVVGDVLADTAGCVSAIPNPSWIDEVRISLLHQPWTSLDQLARRAGVSAAHLSRRFRRLTGLRPVQFRAESRARMATQKIANGAALVDAAVDSGYADQSHMCRDLRLRFGQSPGALLAA